MQNAVILAFTFIYIIFFTICHGLNYVPKTHVVKAVTPSVMVFGCGAFGRGLGVEGRALVMRLVPL